MQKNTKKASCDLSKLRLFQKRVCVCLCVLVCASQYLERHSISQPMNLQKQLSLCIDDDLGYPHYCNFLNCWLHPPFIISIHPQKMVDCCFNPTSDGNSWRYPHHIRIFDRFKPQ